MKQTYFDSVITSNNLQMIKMILPYMNPKIRNTLAIYIKVIELKRVINLNQQLNPPPFLDAIKDVMDSDSLEMYNTILDLINMINDNPDMATSMFGNIDNPNFDMKDLFN